MPGRTRNVKRNHLLNRSALGAYGRAPIGTPRSVSTTDSKITILTRPDIDPSLEQFPASEPFSIRRDSSPAKSNSIDMDSVNDYATGYPPSYPRSSSSRRGFIEEEPELLRSAAPVSLEDFIVPNRNNRLRASVFRESREVKQTDAISASALETASFSSVDERVTSSILRMSNQHPNPKISSSVRPSIDSAVATSRPAFPLHSLAPGRKQSTLDTGSAHGEFRQQEHSNGDLTISHFSVKDEEWEVIGRIEASDVSYFIRFCERSRTDNQHDAQKMELYQEHILTMVKHLGEKRLRNLDALSKKGKTSVLQNPATMTIKASDPFAQCATGQGHTSSSSENYIVGAYGRTPVPVSAHALQQSRTQPFSASNMPAAFPKTGFSIAQQDNIFYPRAYSQVYGRGDDREDARNPRTLLGAGGATGADAMSMRYLRARGIVNDSSATDFSAPSIIPSQRYRTADPLFRSSSPPQPLIPETPLYQSATTKRNTVAASLTPLHDPFIDHASHPSIGRSLSFTKPPSQIRDFVPRAQLKTAGQTPPGPKQLSPYRWPTSLAELREGTEPVTTEELRKVKHSRESGVCNPEAAELTDEELAASIDLRSQLRIRCFAGNGPGNPNPPSLEDYEDARDRFMPDLEDWWLDGTNSFEKLSKTLSTELEESITADSKEEGKVGIPLMAALVQALWSYKVNRDKGNAEPFMQFRSSEASHNTRAMDKVIRPASRHNDERVAIPMLQAPKETTSKRDDSGIVTEDI